MSLPRDVYLYLMNFADDRTILNMLSVNKQFNDPKFFKRILENRYPVTLQFKGEHQSWKDYYLEVIAYIDGIKSEFGYNYSNTATRSPKTYYEFMNKRYTSYRNLYIAAREGDKDLVDFYLTRLDDLSYINHGLIAAIASNNLNMFKYLEGIAIQHNIPINYRTYFLDVMHYQSDKLFDYILSKGLDINRALENAKIGRHVWAIEKLLGRGARYQSKY